MAAASTTTKRRVRGLNVAQARNAPRSIAREPLPLLAPRLLGHAPRSILRGDARAPRAPSGPCRALFAPCCALWPPLALAGLRRAPRLPASARAPHPLARNPRRASSRPLARGPPRARREPAVPPPRSGHELEQAPPHVERVPRWPPEPCSQPRRALAPEHRPEPLAAPRRLRADTSASPWEGYPTNAISSPFPRNSGPIATWPPKFHKKPRASPPDPHLPKLSPRPPFRRDETAPRPISLVAKPFPFGFP